MMFSPHLWRVQLMLFLITGNIRVFCRCRPLRKEEISAGNATIIDFDAAKDGELGILTGGSTKKIFRFDRVYTPKDDQGMLWNVFNQIYGVPINISRVYEIVTGFL